MPFCLGINTGFAINRYSEPEEWIRLVGDFLQLRFVQLTADMLNPDLPNSIIKNQIQKIVHYCDKYNVQISSTFTGAYTRVNHFAHPDPEIRKHWVKWFERFVDITVDVGAQSLGSHFGIFTHQDNRDPQRREERRQQNIENWHKLGNYAKKRGLKFLSWEPMSISREQGETIVEARKLHNDVNKNAPIPFKICLDLDHGDVTSNNSDDTNPYAWIREFATESPLIHLKQSSDDKGGHWPFTAEHNAQGRIIPSKVIKTLLDEGVNNAEFLLELSFRERNPIDDTVDKALKESVEFWRPFVPN